jgi:hypothetical protein
MKSLRKREEDLDNLKQRRKDIASKAESADKRLNKMSPENKNLQSQTELLMGLREQTRDLDAGILAEEAALGNLKREVTRNWMTLKLGGLQELSEKGLVRATLTSSILLLTSGASDRRRVRQVDRQRASPRARTARTATSLLPWPPADRSLW